MASPESLNNAITDNSSQPQTPEKTKKTVTPKISVERVGQLLFEDEPLSREEENFLNSHVREIEEWVKKNAAEQAAQAQKNIPASPVQPMNTVKVNQTVPAKEKATKKPQDTVEASIKLDEEEVSVESVGQLIFDGEQPLSGKDRVFYNKNREDINKYLMVRFAEKAAQIQKDIQETLIQPQDTVGLDSNNAASVDAINQDTQTQLDSAKQAAITKVDEEKKKMVFRVGLVDVSEIAEQQARYAADEQMTADKKELSGWSGFFKKIWKFGYAEQYQHKKKELAAKENIISQNNIYSNESLTDIEKSTSSRRFCEATVGRFLSQTKGLVETDLGERQAELQANTPEERGVKEELKRIIDEYADGQLDEAGFEGAKRQIFADIKNLQTQSTLDKGEMYVDNFLEIAKEVRRLKAEMAQAAGHSVAMEKLEYDIVLVLGKAKSGIKTEAHYNLADKTIERLRQTKLGSMVNETTLALGVAAVTSVMTGASKIVSSKAAAAITFGLSAGVAGVFAAFKENQMQKRERKTLETRETIGASNIQDQLNETKSKIVSLTVSLNQTSDKTEIKQINKELKFYRAEEKKLEDRQAFIYNRCSAKDLARELHLAIQQNSYEAIMRQLTEVEARLEVSNGRNIDLISYSQLTAVEEERTELLQLRVQAKQWLEEFDKKTPPAVPFADHLRALVSERIKKLMGDKGGVDEKDSKFKEHKRQAIQKKMLTQIAVGLTIGVAAQEAYSFVSDGQEGLVENLVKGDNRVLGAKDSLLQSLHNYISGSSVTEQLQNSSVPNGLVKLPASCSWLANSDGSFSLKRGEEVLADNLRFNPNGSLTNEAKGILANSGVNIVDEHSAFIEGTGRGPGSVIGLTPEEYIKQHPNYFTRIAREFWLGNNTEMYQGPDGQWHGADLNELRFDWGGVNGTGINENGDYELSAIRMTSDGSFQTINGQMMSEDAKALLASGQLKVQFVLSDGTQDQVIQLSVNKNGLVQIDQDSEQAKILFAQKNGSAVLQAKYMEVVTVSGQLEDGTQQVRVLATAVGEGLKDIPSQVPPIENTVTTLGLDRAMAMPIPMPIDSRNPLESLPKKPALSVLETPSYYDYYSGSQKEDLVHLNSYRAGSSNVQQLANLLSFPAYPTSPSSSSLGKSPDNVSGTDNVSAATGNKRKGKKLKITLNEEYDAGGDVKGDAVDIQDYKENNDDEANRKRAEELRGKYQHVLVELDELENFDNQSQAYKNRLEKACQHFNSKRNSGDPISLDEYVDQQITRLHHQIDNILISEAKVGDKPFSSEFYERAQLVKGIEKAEEIIIILDDPIGDAVMTIPALISVHKYLELNNFKKPIKLVVSPLCMDLFECVQDQFKGDVELVVYSDISKKFSKDKKKKFVINAKKDFTDYDSLNIPAGANQDLSQVMSVRWDTWLKEEVPKRKGLLEKYDPIPARIMRNFENMFGQKLFDDINKIDHYLEKGRDADKIGDDIKKKYQINSDEQVVVISAGSSVQPKEYEPDKWREVINNTMNKHPKARIMFLKDPDPKRWARYSKVVDDMVAQHQGRVSLVSESTKHLNAIMSLADVVVTPDTGLGHYASALGRPNIMLILGDPVRWSNATTDRVIHQKARETYRKNAGTYAAAWGVPSGYYVNDNGEYIGSSNFKPDTINAVLDKYLSKPKTKGVAK